MRAFISLSSENSLLDKSWGKTNLVSFLIPISGVTDVDFFIFIVCDVSFVLKAVLKAFDNLFPWRDSSLSEDERVTWMRYIPNLPESLRESLPELLRDSLPENLRERISLDVTLSGV